jgi:hypothetical protein
MRKKFYNMGPIFTTLDSLCNLLIGPRAVFNYTKLEILASYKYSAYLFWPIHVTKIIERCEYASRATGNMHGDG